jgi:redox-sensitive bicupin YhaK (pirin superfamily)
VGDVVQVPLRLPHSLQHGVRTIEFQTPVYERMILSFAQQVLTQTHWDTEEAIATMVLRPPPEAAAPLLMDEPGVRVEQIVDFADFSVLRLSLKAGATTSLPVPGALRVGMVVTGRVLLNHLDLGPEEAALLPKGWSENIVVSAPCEAAVFLLAIPVH